MPAGVAVVRISGPNALPALRLLTSMELPAPRQAVLRTIVSQDGLVLDQALVLVFPGPRSFTGEDCVELQLHGSRAVVDAVMKELAKIAGLRPAEAGEFSRRAFENGRIDLVEAEGLSELIAAETEMQRRLAVEQSFGGQSELYNDWARRLTHARAMIEADLDFSDEEDVPGSVADSATAPLLEFQEELRAHVANARAGEIIRDGYRIAIVGPPNVGKSSLLNALADRDVAIVTEIAGTTRDVLQVDLDIDGYLVRLFDTAGLRESSDVVEQEGIRRAHDAMAKADLILLLDEIDSEPEHPAFPEGKEVLHVGSKLDLHGRSSAHDLCISVRSGEGLDTLRDAIRQRVSGLWSGFTAPNRKRQLDLLGEASNFLEEALNAAQPELRAEHLRAAAVSLGKITGAVDVEQLLDVIFSQFCIGK
ncbi:MAG: tRNA uridine-5-carboxymethylaminomethyl(34) synthesis GTPase MnmE [Pseudorhizobium sp.]